MHVFLLRGRQPAYRCPGGLDAFIQYLCLAQLSSGLEASTPIAETPEHPSLSRRPEGAPGQFLSPLSFLLLVLCSVFERGNYRRGTLSTMTLTAGSSQAFAAARKDGLM